MPKLIKVGYWKSEDEPNLPDPTILPQIDPTVKYMVLQYLKNAKTHQYWKGPSWCRFRCGIRDFDMGTTDKTDDKYIWPAGLTHYVEEHNVTLPQEFITHIMTKRLNHVR